MKKLIFLFSLFTSLSIFLFSQTQSAGVFKIADALTAFGKPIPKGSLIYDKDAQIWYYSNDNVLATESLSSSGNISTLNSTGGGNVSVPLNQIAVGSGDDLWGDPNFTWDSFTFNVFGANGFTIDTIGMKFPDLVPENLIVSKENRKYVAFDELSGYFYVTDLDTISQDVEHPLGVFEFTTDKMKSSTDPDSYIKMPGGEINLMSLDGTGKASYITIYEEGYISLSSSLNGDAQVMWITADHIRFNNLNIDEIEEGGIKSAVTKEYVDSKFADDDWEFLNNTLYYNSQSMLSSNPDKSIIHNQYVEFPDLNDSDIDFSSAFSAVTKGWVQNEISDSVNGLSGGGSALSWQDVTDIGATTNNALTVNNTITINQPTDEQALEFNGYDNVSSYWGKIALDMNGWFTTNTFSVYQEKVNGQVTSNATSSRREYQNDYSVAFGTSTNFHLRYDAAKTQFELTDNSGNEFLTVEDVGTNADFQFNGTSTFSGATDINDALQVDALDVETDASVAGVTDLNSAVNFGGASPLFTTPTIINDSYLLWLFVGQATPLTATLPNLLACPGRFYIIVNASNAYDMIITPQTGQLIDGVAGSITLPHSTQFQMISSGNAQVGWVLITERTKL